MLTIASIRFDDCTISGVSLYTPNTLLVLAHMEKKADAKSASENTKRGRQHRHNALEPELRLIDINTKEEIDTDTLSVSRFESLSSSDYHLGVLPPSRIPGNLTQKGYMATLGSGVNAVGSGLYTGVETVGQGMWDATMYGPRMLGVNRIFSGDESVRGGKALPEKTSSAKGPNYLTGWIPGLGSSILGSQSEEITNVATTQGMKIFIYSPYDCIVAVKRNLADRLQWLCKMKRYQEGWELLDEHPEAAGPASEPSEASTPPTPSKTSSFAQSSSVASTNPARVRQQATLAEFFNESASIASPTRDKGRNYSAEREKQRVGELWLRQLTDANNWSEAGEVAGKVLTTSARWEYWLWIFIRNEKFDEISPVVPTFQLQPPLPSSVFEIILGHYVAADRAHFKELLDLWPTDLFEISSISTAIEDQLDSGTAPKGSTDWRHLQESLAKLFLADGHYKDALKCYIHLQDADTAMSLLKEHHLVDAIADDIPSLVLLRISDSQLKSSPQEELRQLSSEPIRLLVDQATHGTVEPDEVVTQLEQASLTLFLFFYLRALWRGEGMDQTPTTPAVGHTAAITSLAADDGKGLVEQFADTAVELFAEYDRDLLMEFLQASTAYTFENAVKVCEKRHLINELVYLLSKTGDLKKALFLIINELNDVSKAIAFAKEQDDEGLWNDLLDYSMSRPRFISGLLAEIGTAIDPITLLKRIPSGLEIEGLKDGLKKMIREYDLQNSISEGVAKVLSSEVAVRMETLRRGRRRGIKFDVTTGAKKTRSRDVLEPASTQGAPDPEDVPDEKKPDIMPGHCTGCGRGFPDDETETIVGFACGHVYHVSHLLHDPEEDGGDKSPPPERQQDDGEDASFGTYKRTVGLKVTNARLLRDRIANVGGCRVCKKEKEKVEQT